MSSHANNSLTEMEEISYLIATPVKVRNIWIYENLGQWQDRIFKAEVIRKDVQ